VNTIYTIGYGGRKLDEMLQQLIENGVDTLVDVRVKPYSRNPEFSIGILKKIKAVKYEWRGNALGGESQSGVRSGSERMRLEAIRDLAFRVRAGAGICLMCMEENPAECHRSQLLEPLIRDCGIEVVHLRKAAAEKREKRKDEKQSQWLMF